MMLVQALRASATVREVILSSGLTDAEAYRVEYELIGQFHKEHTGQLWNTIDERFLDPRFLPETVVKSSQSPLSASSPCYAVDRTTASATSTSAQRF
jgi:hypothetical protein